MFEIEDIKKKLNPEKRRMSAKDKTKQINWLNNFKNQSIAKYKIRIRVVKRSWGKILLLDTVKKFLTFILVQLRPELKQMLLSELL